jgi:hypothetical protein
MEHIETGKGLLIWQIGVLILLGLVILLFIKIYSKSKKRNKM